MKKKIFISTSILVFITATTSLPFTLHFCTMTNSYTFHACKMEKNAQHKCRMENNNKNTHATLSSANCCILKTIDTKVNDNFVASHTARYSPNSIVVFLTDDSAQNWGSFLKEFTDHSDNSPPPLLYDNYLYIQNSVLLI